MKRSDLAAVLFALILGACAILQLTPGGSQVRLVTNPPTDALKGYTDLGTVTCSRGFNFRAVQSNVVQCQHELRNKTSDLGGVLVVVTSQQIGTHDCANCITMVATSYGRESR